ncbi:MAG: AI-2E family transporter [Pseudomonadaceae bacterium]|nr:AI-2E family transporter [Pseudomonadaceae bacterium]
MLPTSLNEKALSRGLLDVLIRAGLIAVLVITCFQIFRPFLDLMLWSVILAITLYPLHGMLKRKLGNSDARAASLIVFIAVGILLVPVYLLGDSMAESVQQTIAVVKSGGLHIPAPADSVANWPLVGKSLHSFWLQASTDLTGLLQTVAPHLKGPSLSLLGKLAGASVGLLMFIFALFIAGIVMAYGDKGSHSAQLIAARISGPDKGPQIAELCTATVRAVAQGVVGIAFIQMLLVGAGFVVMGIPGAGLLALGILLIGIMQLPATLITIPVIAFVFATEGATAATIAFGIYTFVAGMVDNVLKPLLLGRGVAVPMPVILIGALGGMIASGIIGLFIGPVMLAVAYQLFWQWINDQPTTDATSDTSQG